MRRNSAALLRDALGTRVDALATLHDLLTREAWRGAELADVVHAMLAPYNDGEESVQVHGPELRSMPNAALVLSIALHELATNGVKYGALSVPGGRVAITWRLEHATEIAGTTTLDLLWRECRGPPVAYPLRAPSARASSKRASPTS